MGAGWAFAGLAVSVVVLAFVMAALVLGARADRRIEARDGKDDFGHRPGVSLHAATAAHDERRWDVAMAPKVQPRNLRRPGKIRPF